MKKNLFFLILFLGFALLSRQNSIFSQNSETAIVLDSIVVYLGDDDKKSKTEYLYYEDGNVEEEISYFWRTTSWGPRTRTLYQYDKDNNIILKEYYGSWNTSKSEWVGNSKFVYEYDNYGNLLLSEEYNNWDPETKTWLGKLRLVNAYDSNGNNTLVEGYGWDSKNVTWMKDYRFVYGFDGNNNMTFKEYYDGFVDGDWKASSRDAYQYDSNNNQISAIGYKWDSNTWVESTKNIWKYDTESVLLEEEKYTWNKSKSTWVGTSKIDYFFNEEDNYTRINKYLSWDAAKSTFTLSEYSIYYYNELKTNIESVKKSDSVNKIFVSGDMLLIDTPVAELINIYTLSGRKIYSSKKQEGEVSIDIKLFPNVVIINGDSGWSSKILKTN